jgi:hypothetical protein
MNIITWNKAVCLFPRATIIERRLYTAQRHVDHDHQLYPWVKKYSDRNYDVVGPSNVEQFLSREGGFRNVCDVRSWCLSFDCDGRCFYGIIRNLGVDILQALIGGHGLLSQKWRSIGLSTSVTAVNCCNMNRQFGCACKSIFCISKTLYLDTCQRR